MNFTGKVINFVLSLIIFALAIAPVGSIFSPSATNWTIVIASLLIMIHTLMHGSLYGTKAKKKK